MCDFEDFARMQPRHNSYILLYVRAYNIILRHQKQPRKIVEQPPEGEKKNPPPISLFTFELGEDAVRLERLEVEDLYVWQPEASQNVQIDGRQARSLVAHSLRKTGQTVLGCGKRGGGSKPLMCCLPPEGIN